MTIYHDITHAEYSALPGWNWGTLRHIGERSPRYVNWRRRNPDTTETAERRIARGIHAAVLEPTAFARDWHTTDLSRRTKAYKEFVADLPDGAEVLTVAEADRVTAAAAAILDHPAAGALLSDGDGEVSLTWEEDGLALRGRVDWLRKRSVIDLKILGTTHERRVGALVARNLWHGQLAHYVAGCRANGLEVEDAYLIVADGRDAHDVAVYHVDPSPPDGALYVGQELRAGLLDRLRRCVAEDHWPGRHETVQDLCLPGYALIDDDVEV